MATARKQLVSIDATPYYHCVSRCVRRSFLCGQDPLTQQNYEHRREWIEHKIYTLSQIYCIDICAYAIMSNHYHLVVHLNQDKAQNLTDREVVERWRKNHRLPTLVQRWLSGQLVNNAEIKASLNIIDSWRVRLWSLSWLMKELNFAIAVQANKEDNCKGHFWESRFKSQALLDEQALAAAMAYVDLNPLRAGVAETLEDSEHTSIKARLQALTEQKETAPCLFPFTGHSMRTTVEGIPFRLMDYIELVDWTARQYKEGKASMNQSIPPILKRLNVSQITWLKACSQLEKYTATAVGCYYHVQIIKRYLHKSRLNLFRLDK